MKESLVVEFKRHSAGAGPDGERLDTPFYTVGYDFRLRPAPTATPGKSDSGSEGQ
jgi:hydroxyquinol 1,2-dioxygenase